MAFLAALIPDQRRFLLNGSPRYCRECGNRLVHVRQPTDYNPHTGQPTHMRVKIGCEAATCAPGPSSMRVDYVWIEPCETRPPTA